MTYDEELRHYTKGMEAKDVQDMVAVASRLNMTGSSMFLAAYCSGFINGRLSQINKSIHEMSKQTNEHARRNDRNEGRAAAGSEGSVASGGE